MTKEDCVLCGVTFLSEEPANLCPECKEENVEILEKFSYKLMNKEEADKYLVGVDLCLDKNTMKRSEI